MAIKFGTMVSKHPKFKNNIGIPDITNLITNYAFDSSFIQPTKKKEVEDPEVQEPEKTDEDHTDLGYMY